MSKWYQIFPKYPWLSIYAWIVFCIFPFFFIFSSTSPFEIMIGLALNRHILSLPIVFLLSTKGWLLYLSVAIEISISVWMTYLLRLYILLYFLILFNREYTEKS